QLVLFQCLSKPTKGRVLKDIGAKASESCAFCFCPTTNLTFGAPKVREYFTQICNLFSRFFLAKCRKSS
ncbi:MAG: hypothetical protein KI786_18810, partial [Mameliella sp.]|nr:hypothetical protein [Phaeodactylibacter sp.]